MNEKLKSVIEQTRQNRIEKELKKDKYNELKDIKKFEKKHGNVKYTEKALKEYGINPETFNNVARPDPEQEKEHLKSLKNRDKNLKRLIKRLDSQLTEN
jgi:nucleotidyltransferase/DNA polymerase involved in DNA repair